MSERHRICEACDKRKSLPKFEGDNTICRRCMESMPIDREVTMKDLLIALDKINTSIVQLVASKAF